MEGQRTLETPSKDLRRTMMMERWGKGGGNKMASTLEIGFTGWTRETLEKQNYQQNCQTWTPDKLLWMLMLRSGLVPLQTTHRTCLVGGNQKIKASKVDEEWRMMERGRERGRLCIYLPYSNFLVRWTSMWWYATDPKEDGGSVHFASGIGFLKGKYKFGCQTSLKEDG